MSDTEPTPSGINITPTNNEASSGGFTMNLDVMETTPEQKVAMEQYQAKKGVIKGILGDIILPTPEEPQKAEQLKDAFAGNLASIDIPEKDMHDFAQNVYSAVKELNPQEKYFDTLLNTVASAAETVENAKLFSQFAETWNEKFLTNLTSTDPKDWTKYNRISDFNQILYGLTGTNTNPRPEPRSEQEMTELFNAFVDLHEVAYSMPQNEDNRELFNSLIQRGRDVGLKSHDASQASRVVKIFNEVANEPDRALLYKFTDAVLQYGRNHDLTDDAVRGLTKKLFPAMKADSPQIEVLKKPRNQWGMRRGDFGAGDLIVHSYASKISPVNINELMMITREVPTTDAAKLDQNRRDGLALAAPFGALRDFIHDERPYVHEVIEAMVKYYDTGDEQQLKAVLSKTDYLLSEDRQERILDKEQYEREIEETVYRGENTPANKVKAIDTLRRLDENTKPVEEKPPETSDETFNEYLTKLSTEKSQGRIVKEDLGATLQYVNTELISAIGKEEIGIEPNEILALGWLERRAFDVIHGLSYEGQMAAYKQDWFQQVLRFQELTASPKDYDEVSFNQFLDEINNVDFQAAYKLIFQRELESISKLTGKYRDEGHENRASGLWSMNVAHELIGLTDLRPADTTYGKKHRAELKTPLHQRRIGD